MTDWAFVEFMNKLKDAYGAKSYPPERVSIIGEKLRVLHDEDLKILSREIVANSRYAPMLSDILKVAEPLLDLRYKEEHGRKIRELEDRKQRGLSCQHCGDAGLITAWLRETSYSFRFRCPDNLCVAARIHCNASDVRWSDDILEKYLPVFDRDSNHEKFEEASPNWIAAIDAIINAAKPKISATASLVSNVIALTNQTP